jgi:hypothetical protein
MTAERSLWMGLVCAVSTAACSPTSLPAPPREGSAAGSGSVTQESQASAQLIPVVNPGASSAASSGIRGCGPGHYAGSYEADLLGSGPLAFSLVANAQKPALAAPCEEFCPEIVIGADGGEFTASWLGIEGRAKVVGALDCRTGEFRAQLVDGYYGSDPHAPDPIPFLSGDLSGMFQGKFKAAPEPSIEGTFTCKTSITSQGRFSVTLGKP